MMMLEDDDDLNIGDIFQYFNIENEKDIFTRKQFCFTDSVNAKHFWLKYWKDIMKYFDFKRFFCQEAILFHWQRQCQAFLI